MNLFKRKQGRLMKLAGKNARVLVDPISPNIQGIGAYRLLNTEQKAMLHAGLKNVMETGELPTCSIESCIRGTGEICWAFEKKTTKNPMTALHLKARETIKVDFITRAKQKLGIA